MGNHQLKNWIRVAKKFLTDQKEFSRWAIQTKLDLFLLDEQNLVVNFPQLLHPCALAYYCACETPSHQC